MSVLLFGRGHSDGVADKQWKGYFHAAMDARPAFLRSLTNLSEEDVRHFNSHKYSKAGATLLEPISEPFFEFLAKRIPVWITPNALTMMGFSGLLIASFTLMAFCTDGYKPFRQASWLFLASAWGVGGMCIFDAVDGKHARNTKQSSPVGHWLDHGFDAVSVTLIYTNIAWVFGGLNWIAFAALIMIQLQWFSVWFEEANTHIIRFPLIADVEGCLFVVSMTLIAWWFGPEIFQTHLPEIFGLTFRLNEVLSMTVLASNIFYFFASMLRVAMHLHRNNKDSGKSNYCWAFFLSLKMLFPFYLNGLLWFIWYYRSNAVLQDNAFYMLNSMAFVFGTIAVRLILSTLCHKKFSSIQPLLWPLIAFVANTFYPLFDEVVWLHRYMVLTALYYFFTISTIYFQILYTKKMKSN